MQILINRGGQQFGPFTLEQVNQGLAEGRLLPNDFAFYEGLQQWTPLEQIQGVVIPGAAPAAAPAPIQAEIVATPVAVVDESAVVAEPAVAGASKKKRIIMIAGISVGVVAVTCLLLFVYPGILIQKTPEVPIVKPKNFSTANNSTEPDQTNNSNLQSLDISDVGPVTYYGDIKPIFDAKCVECHGGDKTKGKLDLTSPDAIKTVIASGEVVIPSDPMNSELITRILLTEDNEDVMPPKDKGKGGPLSDEEKKEIFAWIKRGAMTDK